MPEDSSLKIETIFHANVHVVWKAWTAPLIILKWFGSDPNGSGVSAKMDVRRGGAFEISFRNSDQTEFTCSGVYFEVIEYQNLNFTWSWKNEPGVESSVFVSFTPTENGVLMKFEHANFGNSSGHDYEKGWRATFVKLARVLAEMQSDV